jgi:hypothetical protein
MYRCCAKGLLVALFVIGNLKVQAQTSSFSNPLTGKENNPYTKYGIGSLINSNNAILQGMGSVTSAYASPYSVNSDNPASYSFLQRSTFEIGAVAQTRNMKGGDISAQSGTATIAYLSLGFPVGKNGGLSLGFRPYATTFYSLVDTISTGGNPPSPAGLMMRNYTGDGGLSLPYIGGSAKYKGLSLGFNFGYLFGNVRHTTAVIPIDQLAINNAYIAEFSNYSNYGGIYWKGGLMYEHALDSNYTFRVGGTVTLNQGIKERVSTYWISSYNFGDTIARDTVLSTTGATGKLNLPLSYSIGVLLARNDKWNVGIDYVGSQWSNFSSTPDVSREENVGSQAYKISIGGELTPDINSLRNYFARMTYRLGLYYGSDYLRISNTALPVYGITAGTSLPFPSVPFPVLVLLLMPEGWEQLPIT